MSVACAGLLAAPRAAQCGRRATPPAAALRCAQPALRRSAALSAGRARPRGGVAVAGLFGLGLPELAVIGGVVAVLFGPSKLPELGKTLGKTVKSFQSAAKARAGASGAAVGRDGPAMHAARAHHRARALAANVNRTHSHAHPRRSLRRS